MKAGTTLECFEDLLGQLQVSKDYHEKRKQLAELVGVEDQTVRRWMTGPGIPVGMSMISLRCYLDFLGYRVQEFLKLSEVLQNSSRLLAFRVMSLDDMAKLTAHENHSDALLAVLRGVRGISAEREALFRDVVSSYGKELNEAMAKLPRLIKTEVPPVPPVAAPVVPIVEKTVASLMKQETLASQSNDKRKEHFKMLTLVLLDYAREFTNPELPEEARDRLREVVGQRNIFDLKNLLVRLCGNTAFKHNQS